MQEIRGGSVWHSFVCVCVSVLVCAYDIVCSCSRVSVFACGILTGYMKPKGEWKQDSPALPVSEMKIYSGSQCLTST